MKPLPLIALLLLTGCAHKRTLSDYEERYNQAKIIANCDQSKEWCRIKTERLVNGSY